MRMLLSRDLILCASVARLTVLPAENTGSSSATGVVFRVRPTFDDNVEQTRFHALGFVFVSDRPARRFRGESKSLALGERIDFHHRAVGLIREIFPDAVEFVDRL